ncbi:PREDICTED: uncharacterized protein LOC101290891 [Fragaria vesca subsp. vesca]|uniref:uncharacterized protein LOC101290891 n=1 Tax=Fragaria vesca subsp. vesca TaxID=101020 RepID=UPI0002C33C64|nr:PREDICTED: uncharacterized protein LOC101290891 [Fragaria vesca subsp. vesca]
MQVPRWRNFMILRNSLIPSTCTATRLASFHSTPSSFEKRKDKWNFDVKSSEQPSKNFIRYATRHKRADAKKALKNLLFNCGYCPKVSYQHIQAEDASGSSPKNHRSNSYRHAQKSHHKKMKRKLKRESFSDDENHPETIFQATYGKRWYTWSFNAQHNSFQDSSYGFEWREPSSWKDTKKSWENISGIETDDEECTIGSSSDRKILGLPSTGPLKTEDVKKAFHLSALKWHPDKHQGSSQEMAAEKFRHCVNAYNSLCNALSSA